jgi:predicted amidohydrolase
MPVMVKVAIWNAMTEVGAIAGYQGDLASFTNLLKWQDRLTLLRAAVALADNALPIPTGLTTGTSVLRLFLAPEYYFAQSCDQHVMDYETRGHVVEGLAKISANHREMLLIPGTVSYFKPLVDKSLEKRRLKLKPAHQERVVKYAGYVKKGEENSMYLAHNTAYAFYNGQQVFKYRKRLDASELNTQDKNAVKTGKVMVFATGDAVGTFDFDKAGPTLRIGLEICADHSGGELKKCGASDLHLQLVLAASTSMKSDFAVVRDGGCVFLCSANSDSTDGKGRAWQSLAGKLVDLRDADGANFPARERMDPLARPELKSLKSKTAKLDAGYENAHRGYVHHTQLPGKVQRYLQARGGSVHFYEATIP